MYCNYCRALNPNDAVYCSKCGRTISRTLNSDEADAETHKATGPLPIDTPSPFSIRQKDELPSAHINLESTSDARKTSAPLVPVPTSTSELPLHDESVTAPVLGNARDGESGIPSFPAKLDSSLPVPVYGSMGKRFTAYFADLIAIYFLALIFYVVAFAFQLPVTGNEGESQAVWFAALFVYMIVAQTSYHTTIGKYVHGLEVCSAKTDRKYPAFWRIFLRETFGRLFSSFFWGLGYWMALRKAKVQAWSDELAGTVVTVRPTNKVLVRALTAFVFVAFFLDVGLTGYGLYKDEKNKQYAALRRDMDAAGNDVVAAREAFDRRLNSASAVKTWDDFELWQEVMESLKGDLDKYETKIDQTQILIQKGISEDLAASKAERNQLVVLRQVYELRKQQAEKYRQEANLVVGCEKTQTAVDGLRNDLQLLDSDIKGLDNQASQLLAELKTK